VHPSTPTHRSGTAPRLDDGATSLRFASAVRALGDAARIEGWVVPAFRSPPRLAGVDRTLRRRVDGGATVAVRLRERPWPAVVADMIDGLLAANQLVGPDAAGARSVLWRAVQRAGLVDVVADGGLRPVGTGAAA
jgi:hypothetical protein